MNEKWIFPLILLAVYAYNAYRTFKKKQEEEEEKKHPNPGLPAPTAQELPKPVKDIFRELFGEEALPKPAPKPAYKPSPVKKQPIKPAPKRQPAKIIDSIPAYEGEATVMDIHSDSAKSTLSAYQISSSQAPSYTFNAREAFIGSIIFERPEY